MLVFIFGMMAGMTAQTTYVRVTITMNDGTEATYDMQSNSYMYFEESVKLVITESVDGMNTVTYPLADIRKITCEELEGTPDNTTIDVAIYPNPVYDVLHFRNVNGKRNVNIYAIDGRLMKSFLLIGDQNVDISDLPKGLYLVNVSYNTYKMLKL